MKPHRLLFVFLFLAACTPMGVKSIDPASNGGEQISTPSGSVLPAEQGPSSPVPDIQYPISIFDQLPVLESIRAENADDLVPIASLNMETISDVVLTEGRDQIFLNTSIGVQSIALPDFEVGEYTPRSGFIFDRKFSPDGRYMAELLPGNPRIFDMTLEITDMESGKLLCSFGPLFTANTMELVVYQDGSVVYISNDSQSKIQRWDTSKCQVTFNEQADRPALDVSSDGKMAALVKDNELFIYTTAGFSKKGLLESAQLRGAYFLPDGKSILVSFQSGNAIYDINSGEKTHDFPGKMGNYYIRYRPSLDGKWLLISGENTNRILRLSDFTLFNLPSDFMNLSNNPLSRGFELVENGYLITKDYIWDIERGIRVADIKKYGTWMFDKMVLTSADRSYAAISRYSEPYAIDVIDLSTGKTALAIPDYHNPIALPDGTGFIATHHGHTAFFNFISDQPLKLLDVYYTDGQSMGDGTLMIWDDQGNLHQIDPVSRSLLHSISLPFVSPDAVPQNLAPNWVQGGQNSFEAFLSRFMTTRWSTWVVSNDRQVGVRETQSGIIQFFRMQANSQVWRDIPTEDVILNVSSGDVYEMTFSPDDRYVAGLFKQKIVIWEALTGRELIAIPLPNEPGVVTDFDFSPDGSKLFISHEKFTRDFSVSIHTDSILRIYEVQTGRLLKYFEIKQDFRKSGCNISQPFVIAADSTQLYSITENCKLGIYDTTTWELRGEFHEPFKDSNIDLALSPDNRLMAVAYQNKLELWDISTMKLLKSYGNPLLNIYPKHRDAELSYQYQIAFSEDGSLLGTRFSGGYGLEYNSIVTLWGVP
ncbi:MAG TPA: hypothetical protein DCY14_06345 [Anaerolineae bacterium]|nr:hypothetical protein [Anaerolineae bacterium]HRJ58252.1 hypothetical protein [Anaerolineales bacterium]